MEGLYQTPPPSQFSVLWLFPVSPGICISIFPGSMQPQLGNHTKGQP